MLKKSSISARLLLSGSWKREVLRPENMYCPQIKGLLVFLTNNNLRHSSSSFQLF